MHAYGVIQAGRVDQGVQVQQEPAQSLPPCCLYQRSLAVVSPCLFLVVLFFIPLVDLWVGVRACVRACAMPPNRLLLFLTFVA